MRFIGDVLHRLSGPAPKGAPAALMNGVLAAAVGIAVAVAAQPPAFAQPTPPESNSEDAAASSTAEEKAEGENAQVAPAEDEQPPAGTSPDSISSPPAPDAPPVQSETVADPEPELKEVEATDAAVDNVNTKAGEAETPQTAVADDTGDVSEKQDDGPTATPDETAAEDVGTEAEAAATEAALPEQSKDNDKRLVVAIWPAAYGAAQTEAVLKPFETERGIEIEAIARKRDEAPLKDSNNIALPDAVEFSLEELEAACSEGALLKLRETATSPQEEEADFLAGSLHACGTGAFIWSHVFVAAEGAFKNSPGTIADAFNTKRFPGKRAFLKDPKFLLEAALLAEGIKPDSVYEMLDSPEGRQRAFRRLDLVKRKVTWVESSSAAIDALRTGEAAIAQTFSGRAFFESVRGAPLNIIWDGQVYAMTYWAIPAASKRQELAREFIDFAVAPKQLAAVASRYPYGPTRTSATTMAAREVNAGLTLAHYLPSSEGNFERALRLDEVWWRDNGDTVRAEFEAWLKKPAPEEGWIPPPRARPQR